MSEADDPNRRTSQYFDGRNAFKRGLTVDDCPYRAGLNRQSWMTGWYDERTWNRLGHIFRARKVSWP